MFATHEMTFNKYFFQLGPQIIRVLVILLWMIISVLKQNWKALQPRGFYVLQHYFPDAGLHIHMCVSEIFA